MINNVLDYFENSIGRVPDKVAFANDKEALTFKQVYDSMNAIGSFLSGKGFYRRPVVVFMRKHPKEIAAFFGVIRGGCFYVPIDEEMPQTRIQLILDTIHSPLIICDEQTKKKTDKFNFDGEIVDYEDVVKTEVDMAAIERIHASALDTDPIYIVFTSGSTGVPKGVVACHRSVIDYIEQLSDVLEFNEDTVFGNQTPLYFDACLKELYPTLKFGATTYLIPKSLFMFPIKLVEFLNEKKINTICWVVSALTMISSLDAFNTVVPEHLHTVAFGSEVFPIKQFEIWKSVLPNAKFTNLYGPTEGTGMCCYYKVEKDFAPDEVIPIGRPFKNTEIMLLTEKNELAKDGEPGEICIRGTSVTLGYYNNPEKTAEAYVQNPLNTVYPEIIYRTGDIGKRDADGNLLFISRKDYQIKHMGHRIELGEIEANVNMLDGVRMSGCIYDKSTDKIVLFYTGDVEEKDVVKLLRGALPRYMLPNKTVKLDNMPFTANGKIDRVTLKKMNEETE